MNIIVQQPLLNQLPQTSVLLVRLECIAKGGGVATLFNDVYQCRQLSYVKLLLRVYMCLWLWCLMLLFMTITVYSWNNNLC